MGDSGLMLIDLVEQLSKLLEIHGNCPVFVDIDGAQSHCSENHFDRVLDVEYSSFSGEAVAIKTYTHL